MEIKIDNLIGLVDNPDQKKAIILVHGFAVDKDDCGLFSGFAETIKDFAVYRFDHTGCGQSEGDFTKTTLSDYIEDLRKIVAYVKDRHDWVAIWGQSFGTAVTIALSPDVDKIVLTGAFHESYKLFKQYFGDGFKSDGISERKSSSSGNVTAVEAGFWSDLKKYDLLELAAKISTPVFLIHGGEDTDVPKDQAEKLFEVMKNRKIMIIGGADHGLEPDRDQVYRIVKEFLKK